MPERATVPTRDASYDYSNWLNQRRPSLRAPDSAALEILQTIQWDLDHQSGLISGRVLDVVYEFLERLISVALPRIRDFKGISSKLDGRGNYTLGVTEQIIFPEIDLDKIAKIMGLQVTFVTSADTDEEALALLKHFGLPFKNLKN